MGLIWRLATPTSEDKEKQDNATYTWGNYVGKLVEVVISRHKKAKRIICVNDTYKSAHSIKDSGRFIGKSNKPVKNEFMKSQNRDYYVYMLNMTLHCLPYITVSEQLDI